MGKEIQRAENSYNGGPPRWLRCTLDGVPAWSQSLEFLRANTDSEPSQAKKRHRQVHEYAWLLLSLPGGACALQIIEELRRGREGVDLKARSPQTRRRRKS